MIAFTKRSIGSVAATALCGAEVIGVYLWFRWIIDPLNADFDATLYDGSVGFGAKRKFGELRTAPRPLVISKTSVH